MRFIAILLSSLALAQEPVASPRGALLLNPDGQIRTLHGVPGAAHMELTTDRSTYSALHAASHAPVGIAIAATGLRLFTTESASALSERNVAAVAISPRGAYFALLAGERLQVYTTAAPQQPCKVHPLPRFGIITPEPATIAVSDAGTVVLATTDRVAYADLDGHTSYAPLTLQHMRFAPSQSNVVTAFDSRDDTLVQVHLPTFAVEPLARRHEGIAAPTGLEFSRDGRSLWISRAAGLPTLQYIFESRSLIEHVLPTGRLVSIGSGGVYQWTVDSILDTTRTVPAVLIVPTHSQEDK